MKTIINFIKDNDIKDFLVKFFIVFILLLLIKTPAEQGILNAILLGIVLGVIMLLIDIFENYIIKNITLIVFILIALIITEPEKVSEYKDLYLLIGGLFAFWYGYKKYERDKELEIIDKYAKRYILIHYKSYREK